MNNISLVNISFSKTHMSHIMSKFQAKQSRSILFPNKKLTRVLDTIPIGWLWSCQSTIEHFTFFVRWSFVSSKPDVTITWSNPLHLDVSAENGVFFLAKATDVVSASGGKLQVVFFFAATAWSFSPGSACCNYFIIQRCKNVCDLNVYLYINTKIIHTPSPVFPLSWWLGSIFNQKVQPKKTVQRFQGFDVFSLLFFLFWSNWFWRNTSLLRLSGMRGSLESNIYSTILSTKKLIRIRNTFWLAKKDFLFWLLKRKYGLWPGVQSLVVDNPWGVSGIKQVLGEDSGTPGIHWRIYK